MIFLAISYYDVIYFGVILINTGLKNICLSNNYALDRLDYQQRKYEIIRKALGSDWFWKPRVLLLHVKNWHRENDRMQTDQ